jgi:vitamin B12 transporter
MVRFSGFFLLVVSLLFVPAALAGEIQIKVVDPHAAAVAGAQVFVYHAADSAPVQVRSTSGEGVAVFDVSDSKSLRVEVLAPGFAVARADVPSATSALTVGLKVASASDIVVVTATRTPVAEQDTASSISLLTSDELTAMQPESLGDALRFLPDAVVNVAGQRGGLGSLFVRGGDSRYNKVLVDGVPVNEPGGTFDFGSVPMGEVDRVEFQRGTQSTLYGSDAMTSVLQVFTRNGTTAVPELRFGADGGNFGTAHGYVSLAGARSFFDYNLFADQFQTNGQGPNADYGNALQGGNVGVQISPSILFRVRARHSNRRTGVPGEWDFNGQRLLPPDIDQRARSNNFLGSAELLISGPSHWQHRLSGYEYNIRRLNQDDFEDPGRGCGTFIDCPFLNTAHINRAGFMYQGDYTPRSWAQTTVGYEFEDENARLFSSFPPTVKGLRLNHAVYLQQRVAWKRLLAIVGARYAHNGTFGDTGVPRVALSLLAFRGGNLFSGTRLRFSYATGIKEPRFDESSASGPGIIPNAHLRPERNRSFDAGFEQGFLGGKYSFSAIYFNNLFHDQIDFAIVDPITFTGQYANINKSMAHGAEIELTGRLTSHFSLNGGYIYTSSQILEQPFAFDDVHQPGQPLLRRPKHLGNILITYSGSRWGANLGGSFVGRRLDSDFLFSPDFHVTHAAGYARVDLGGWYAINSHVTAYANVENALNNHYNEVVGYPALSANFTAGMRFRIGGE